MMIKTILRAAGVASIPAVLVLMALGATAQESGGGDSSGGRDSNDFSRQVMIRVQLVESSRFHPRQLVIAWPGIDWEGTTGDIADALDFIDIDRPATQRDEGKVNLGKLPVLGSLFRKTNLVQDTAAAEFRGSTPVGQVSRIGDTLLLEMLAGLQRGRLRNINRVVIANGDYSYILEGLMSERVRGNEDKVPWLSKLPLVGGFFGIGEARQKGNSLLILIDPHLVDVEE